ncbi:unnamed protein product [Brassica oleracea]
MGKGVANSLTSRQLRSRLQPVRYVVLAWPWPRFCRSNEGNCTAGAHHRTRNHRALFSLRFYCLHATPSSNRHRFTKNSSSLAKY